MIKDKTIRTLKELIPLVIDYVEKEKGFIGLCISTTYMCDLDIITDDEEYFIDQQFKNYAKVKGIYNKGNVWWKSGRKQPRIEFLKELLKLQK